MKKLFFTNFLIFIITYNLNCADSLNERFELPELTYNILGAILMNDTLKFNDWLNQTATEKEKNDSLYIAIYYEKFDFVDMMFAAGATFEPNFLSNILSIGTRLLVIKLLIEKYNIKIDGIALEKAKKYMESHEGTDEKRVHEYQSIIDYLNKEIKYRQSIKDILISNNYLPKVLQSIIFQYICHD